MKYLAEYRDKNVVLNYVDQIKKITKNNWSIMEICGGQTHTIIKYQLDHLLPRMINMIHGPGCPVCVTPKNIIDKAIAIANIPKVIFCSFGDMLKVPGNMGNLSKAKSNGANIKIVYSPIDALKLAEKHHDYDVVFFGIGFETTAPTTALALYLAKKENINNFFVLCSHFLVPPAIDMMFNEKNIKADGLLAAGHVCSIMGYEEYEILSNKFNIPIVVTGFEPVDIVEGIYLCISQLENNSSHVVNQYARCVKQEGNKEAQKIMRKVFNVTNRTWQGIGEIKNSGLNINEDYADFDAEKKFIIKENNHNNTDICISKQIMLGQKKPPECPYFRKKCTPSHPLGAPMISKEGACMAYYQRI